ncbi:type I transaminase [Fusarium heterosporum]|uniref:Type I transaminase n=1 Tax=Fusarium heterosporum TaxID=42747 RepID=A0A8H5SX53_FUSHE|nr:type I transaminase [Fusarium heterosporum]
MKFSIFTLAAAVPALTATVPALAVAGHASVNAAQEVKRDNCKLTLQWLTNWNEGGLRRYRVQLITSPRNDAHLDQFCAYIKTNSAGSQNLQCFWTDGMFVIDDSRGEGIPGHTDDPGYVGSYPTVRSTHPMWPQATRSGWKLWRGRALVNIQFARMPICKSSRAMTFTGCWTCKARKIACDERPIACKNCEKRGVTCGGYGIRLRWLSDPLAEVHTSSGYQGRRTLKLDQASIVYESETIDMFLSHIDRDTQQELSSRQGPFSVFSAGGASLLEMDMPHTTHDSSSATTTTQDGGLFNDNQLEQSVEDQTTYQLQPITPILDLNTEILLPSEPAISSFDLFTGFEHTSTSPTLIDEVLESEIAQKKQPLIAEADLDKTNNQDTTAVETGIFEDSEIAFLMNHYDTHVASLLMPVAHSENPFRRLYLSTAIEGIMNHSHVRTSKGMAYNALYQSLLASAAFHRWNCDQKQVMHRETGARYRHQAIQSLHNAISNAASVANYQVLMMAILSLVTIGVLSGEGEEFRLHLEAATQLRNSRSRWKLMSRPSQQLNEFGAFLAMISRTMSFKASPLPWNDSNKQATAEEDSTIQSSACYEYVYGIKPSIAVAINRTCRLAEYLVRIREEGEQQMSDDFLEDCEQLGDMLESWRLEEESPTSISSDDDLGVLIFTHQAKAWHSAALIYYYTRVQGAQPTDLVQEINAVAEHMYATEDIKSRSDPLRQDNPMAPITWPAFVASCNALGNMRQVWRTWWESLHHYKIGNIAKQWSVVERIWEVLDIAKNRGIRIDWTMAYDKSTICVKGYITTKMKFERMPIEIESPEEYGYDKIKYNLSESSVTDQTLESLNLRIPNLTLLYNEHRGETELRKLVADDANVSADDVLITSGAAGALFIITTSQLASTPGSGPHHLVVVRPNYATNLETPKAVGCEISYIDVTFENGFQPNIDDIEASIKANTRLVSVTCPHNPTGSTLSREALDRLVAVTKKKGVLLLVDETYRDIAFGEKLPVAASLGDHVLSVSSLSKSFGMPGVRIGWLITTNKRLQETFLAAKEQISISGSVINEWIAIDVLSRRQKILSDTTSEMKIRLQMVESWITGEELLEWVKPTGGVVCFPRIKEEPKGGLPAFYERLLKKHATYVGPGHWFELSDSFFRLGYGWPTREELEGGMKAISAALRDQ